MSNKRPIRYKPPKPPAPPGGGRSQSPEMLGGDKSGGPSWMKWALIGAAVVIAGLVFAMLTQKKPQPKVVQKTVEEKPVAKKKPTSWGENYSTTFRYGNNIVTVESVKVTKLNKKVSNVSYQVLLRNSRGKTSWIRENGRFIIRSPGVAAPPSSPIQVSKIGVQYRMKINFKWPRKRLYLGSSLQMTIPGEGVSERVLVGLEVPRDNQGSIDRKGVSALTR